MKFSAFFLLCLAFLLVVQAHQRPQVREENNEDELHEFEQQLELVKEQLPKETPHLEVIDPSQIKVDYEDEGEDEEEDIDIVKEEEDDEDEEEEEEEFVEDEGEDDDEDEHDRSDVNKEKEEDDDEDDDDKEDEQPKWDHGKWGHGKWSHGKWGHGHGKYSHGKWSHSNNNDAEDTVSHQNGRYSHGHWKHHQNQNSNSYPQFSRPHAQGSENTEGNRVPGQWYRPHHGHHGHHGYGHGHGHSSSTPEEEQWDLLEQEEPEDQNEIKNFANTCIQKMKNFFSNVTQWYHGLSPALKVLVGTLLGLIIGIVLLSIFNCFLSCFGKGSYKDNLKAYSAQYTSLPQDEKVVQKVGETNV